MSDRRKTKSQLLDEMVELRREVDRLKAVEAEYLAHQQILKQPDGTGQSPEILRTIVDATPDWIFIKDREHRYRLVNRSYAATMGLVPEEFIGKNDLEIGFPEEVVKGDEAKGIRGFWADDRAVLDSGEPKLIEVEPAVIDGEPAYLRTRKIPLRDGAGEVWGVLGFVQIITEQKRAEELLAKRASQLETVAEVSTAIATILKVEKLLQEVVDLTKERFDLYHAHIYLLDETGDSLNLAAGAGEVGRQMVAEGWHIPLDREQSLVAEAARTGRGVIVNDVQTAPGFMPNPLLPDTQAEMAVPMMIGERVVGVLDVQADVIGRFTDEDVQIQTTLAAQIAVALENASQHEQTRTALAEVQQSQSLMRSIIDATPDWIFIKDREHRYRLVNQGYAGDLHILPDDFIGRNDLELGFPEELVKGNPQKGIRGFWTDDRLVMDSGETKVYPNDPATIDGEIHIFHTIKTPLRDASGQVWGVLAFARDITERQEAEEALRESQAQLSEALDIARVGYWELDAESQMFTFNDQIYSLYHTSVEQEGGYQMPVSDFAQRFVHPEEAASVGVEIARAMETSDPNYTANFVNRINCADGEQIYVAVQIRIVKDEQGRTVRLYGTNQDITEQKQAEVELTEATIFMDSIIENLPTMLFVKDAEDLRFVRWNKAGEELLGYSREDMLGKNDYDFFPREEADFFTAKDREVLTGDQVVEIPEEPIGTLHQGTRLLRTRKIPILGSDGKPKYLLGLSEDITEQMTTRSERQRLLAEVQRLAAIVENHPDFIGIGSLEGEALYINPSGLNMVGLPLDQDISQIDFMQFNPPDEVEQFVKEAIPTAFEAGFWTAEGNLLRVDGTSVTVEKTVAINYDADKKPVSLSVTMRDVTDRKTAEAERERLLAEVEAAYRQYVQQEWQQFLGEQHRGRWRIEHQQVVGLPESPSDSDKTGAALEVPVSLRGQAIGTLSLEDIAPNRNWTTEEKALVETVSQQLALTIENLRLFEDTQQQATREHLARQITDKMRSAPNVDSIVETGLTELAKALGVSRTYVKFTSRLEEEDELQPPVSKIEAIRSKLKSNGREEPSSSKLPDKRIDHPDQSEEI